MIGLLLTNFYSVDVAKMERDDRLLFECQAEVRDLEPDEVISTWMKCDEKAVERGLDHIRPMIQGFALEAQLKRDYAEWQESDPVAWSKVLLGSMANRPDVVLPHEQVKSAWLTLLKDRTASDNLAKVGSVTVRWQDKVEGKGEHDELDEQVRRHLLDYGWSVPEPDSWDAGESSIIIMATPTVTHSEWEKNTELKITSASIVAEDVRYKGLEQKGKPISVSAEHQDNDRDKARRNAFDALGQSFAQVLLEDVVRQLFKGYEVPAPPE